MRKRLALIVACGLGIAACGGSAPSDGPTKNAPKGSQALAFSQCMRAHGVSNFPDPSSAGGGAVRIAIGPNSGVNGKSPAFQSAEKSCTHLLPGGGPASGPPSPQARAQLLRVSECMRAHGITGFPDPTTTTPSSAANAAIVMAHGGVFLAIPSSIDIQSPAFKQAAAVCGFGPRGGQSVKG